MFTHPQLIEHGLILESSRIPASAGFFLFIFLVEILRALNMVKLCIKYVIMFAILYEVFDMNGLTFINGATVSATDVRKSWSKIVQGVKDNHKPVFVCTNNTPEAVVLSVEDFQNMQEIVETFRREQLGQQMASDLLDIAQLTNQPIKTMVLNSKGVFEEAKGQ